LLSRPNSTRAIAFESVSQRAEPFAPQTAIPFGLDGRMVNDNLGDVGDVLVGISHHGMSSNRVRIGIGHIGGGPPDDPTPTPKPNSTPELGSGASLHGKRLFPAYNPWNQDISMLPVAPNSTNLIASIGSNTGLHPDFGTVYNGAPNGIPYMVVSGTQTLAPINFTSYGDESDQGPYPIPANAPIEGGRNSNGDRHVLVIDRDNWKLYELYRAFPVNGWPARTPAVAQFLTCTRMRCVLRDGPRRTRRDYLSFPGWCVMTKYLSRA